MNKTIIIVPFLLSVLLVVAAAAVNKSIRILFLTPVTSPSHSTFFRPVVEALAERGHSVTYCNGRKPVGGSNGISNPVKHLYSNAVGKLNVECAAAAALNAPLTSTSLCRVAVAM